MQLHRVTPVDVNAGILHKTLTVQPTTDVLEDALRIYVAAACTAAAFAHLQQYCSAGCVLWHGNELKNDLANCFNWTSECLVSIGEHIAKMKQPSLVFMLGSTFSRYRVWFDAARSALEHAAGLVYEGLLASLAVCAKEVEALTPRYAHLFQKVVSPLVKRVLLQSVGRTKLMDQTVCLHGRLTAAVAFQRRVFCACQPNEEQIAAIQNTFVSAKAACSVTAACSVIYEVPAGTKQRAERDKLLSRARPEYPACLLAALEAL